MKRMKLLAPIIVLLVVFGSGTALGVDNDTDGNNYFHVGNFCQYGSDGIIGKYALSGLDGCVISVYSAEGAHLLDVIYKVDHIELYLQVMDNKIIEKLLGEEDWLKVKDYINEISYKKLTFEGSQCRYSDGNCNVEMHDTSISFLKICTTGDIIFSNLSGYNITREGNVIELSKENFSGVIISNHMLDEKEGNIIASREIMFRGTNLEPLSDGTKNLRTVEEAIRTGTLGGEITIVKEDGKYKVDSVSYYSNVTIENGTLTSKKAEFVVSGDDHTTGKTIKVNVGKGAISSKNLKVVFDGKEIPLADSLTDVLNPNDDGLQPEYVLVNITSGSGGEFFLLISIPHFSEHTIIVESIVKNPVFIGMAAVCAMTVVIAAAWGMFRRDKSTI